MKKSIFLIFLCLLSFEIISQTSIDTIWTKTLGGSLDEPVNYSYDAIVKMAIYNDEFLYIVTNTQSNDFCVNGSFDDDYTDCWLIKLNTQGDTIWTKVFGGSDYDAAMDIVVLDDGGCAIAGFTFSNDNDFTGNHDSNGEYKDGFIIRFDADGNKIWSKLYGGSYTFAGGQDDFRKIIVASDGNLVVAGQTNSINGDLTFDMDKFACGWVLKANIETGTKIFSKKIAGKLHDEFNATELNSIIETDIPNNYLVAGNQYYFLSPKYFIAQFDGNDTIWTKEFGENESTLKSMTKLNEYFYIAGNVSSNKKNKFFGGFDIWILKIDENGVIQKDIIIGGTDHESAYTITTDSNSLFVAAHTRSIDFYSPGDTIGGADFWLVKLNSDLDTLNTYKFGGTNVDILNDIKFNADYSNFYVCGKTESNDFYINQNYGGIDIWVSQVKPYEPISISKSENKNLLVYPNPASDFINITNCNNTIYIYNSTGQLVNIFENTNNIFNISNLEQGMYFIKSGDDKSIFIKK